MRDERSVKWILGISVYLFLLYGLSFGNFFFFGGSRFISLPFLSSPLRLTPIEFLWYVISAADILFFVLTITFATLFTAGFGYKNLMFKLSVYFFILSCSFLILKFAQPLFAMTFRY